MPHQHADARRSAEYFSLGLGDDRKLYRTKVVAGALSILALMAMSITSLYRVPNPVWPVAVAVLAVGLGVAISARVVRHGPAGNREPTPGDITVTRSPDLVGAVRQLGADVAGAGAADDRSGPSGPAQSFNERRLNRPSANAARAVTSAPNP